MRSQLVIIIYAFICLYIVFNGSRHKKDYIQFDTNGYYIYLPAVFKYNDLGNLSFYNNILKRYNGDSIQNYCVLQKQTGRVLNQYAVGTALFEAPFYFLASLYCNFTNYPAPYNDGYSTPYKITIIFSGIFWTVIALFILRRFLKNYFNDSTIAITLACVAFGTNLYCYTAFDYGLSHPYSFFLFSALLYCTDNWYRTTRKKHIYLAGITIGMLLITRPIDALGLVLPLCWNVKDLKGLKNNFKIIAVKYKDVLFAILLTFLVSLIQMSYWKYTSGHWITFSYGHNYFDFAHPHIIAGLISYTKGWFLYTPIALISILGTITMWKNNGGLVLPLVLFLIIMIYVVFSWDNWWYGGGFACRAMIDILPVLAFPLASLIAFIYNNTKLVYKIFFSVLLVFFIALNIFQTYQYSLGLFNNGSMNRPYYWRIFGKTKITEDDWKLLQQEESL